MNPVRRPRWPLVAGAAALLLAALLLLQPWRVAAPAAVPVPLATLQARDFHSLVVDPANAERLLVGTHSGVRESADGGRSWRPLGGMGGDAMSMAMVAADPARLYVAGHDIFKRSDDGGRTWVDMASDLPGSDLHGFAVDPRDADRLYALVAGAGLFASSDGGARWRALPAQPPGAAGALALVVGAPARLYAATALGLMYSADEGSSWHPAGAGLPTGGDGAVQALAASPDGGQLYAGTADGIYASAGGGSWRRLALAGQNIVALAAAGAAPPRLYALTAAGAFYRLEGATLGSP